MHCKQTLGSFARLLYGAALVGFFYGDALAQTPFCKTITVIQGREPGGTGDMRSKAVTMFLQKYIPGNPTVIHEYMGGGGGLRAANHIFSSARPDGLTIGSVSSGMLSISVLGGAGVKYTPEKFFYLGSPDGGGQFLFYTRQGSGVRKHREAAGELRV